MSDVSLWRDATNYSRDERGKVAPRSWEATFGGVRILIMSEHIYFRPDWAMLCRPVLGNEPIRLAQAETDLEVVKAAALEMVHAKIGVTIASLQSAKMAIAAARGAS